MTLGLYEQRARRRQRWRWSLFKWLVALGAIAAAGLFAYESGSTLSQRRVVALEQEIAGYTSEVEQLKADKTALESALAEVRSQLAEAQERYDQDVPTGQIADLLAVVRDKLEAGVDPERLAFLIGAAENTRTCDATPVVKRFIVSTPLYTGANDSIGFADSTITVTAEGASATDSSGNLEAWFDPAQPITLHVTHIGGKSWDASGKLPLHTSIVIGDREHRFSVVPGSNRGFVQVTSDSCAFP